MQPPRIRRTSILVIAIALAVALVSMSYAGRRQQSLVLIVLFAAWVTAPFAAAIGANVVASRWPARVQRAVRYATVAVPAASAVFYACVAFAGLPLKVGFAFLVGPFVSWLGMAIPVAIAAATRGARK